MHLIDWLVLGFTLITIVTYGTIKTRGSKNVQDYVKGGSSSKWWTIGLSVMATQASAITFLSTPGQAFNDGMGFVQFYFGVPLAMVVVCMVFIPIYHKLNVYTAYEFLERRFDVKTRSLTASLFLLQRGLAAGITIYAPAIILSVVLGWNLTYLNIIIGTLATIYTVSGGTKAVNITQKHQMAVIFSGMFVTFFLILKFLPQEINFTEAINIAAISDKMNILNFSFDFENRYTIWSGFIGGTFLALSYVGTDQSQVQRYLSGKSVKDMQLGLIFNGLLKVPMQFFILLVGVMVFVFYQFNYSPLHFNPEAEKVVKNSSYAQAYNQLETDYHLLLDQKANLLKANAKSNEESKTVSALEAIKQQEQTQKTQALALIQKAAQETKTDVELNDRDYVFIHFILENLPIGLIGLLLAVIISAAMSSTASELNALATTTSLDIYKRNFNPNDTDLHYVKASKYFTLLWGIIAIGIACVAYLAENLIQLVNIIGSVFYGNVLGIFLLAFFVKQVKSNAVFTAAIITQCIIILGWKLDWMPFLWLNLFGCVLVMGSAIILQQFSKK